MTDWDTLLSGDGVAVMKRFAVGETSMRQVSKAFKNTDYAGHFRTLVRNGGTDRARNLARKALRRRSLLN